MSIKTSKIPRCCMTCDRNKRTENPAGGIVCRCEIDGTYIGYMVIDIHSCRHYALDKRYKPGGEWYEKEHTAENPQTGL